MIDLTRLNHSPVVLNCDLIECIETTPDTVISLINGQKLMVLESADEIISRVIEYRRRIQTGLARETGSHIPHRDTADALAISTRMGDHGDR
jgi:flagellar protein FlbD